MNHSFDILSSEDIFEWFGMIDVDPDEVDFGVLRILFSTILFILIRGCRRSRTGRTAHFLLIQGGIMQNN